MSTAKVMICPVCCKPITAGQRHKNTIYASRNGIPVSDQAHYPACYLQAHRRPSIPVPAQPALFAATH